MRASVGQPLTSGVLQISGFGVKGLPFSPGLHMLFLQNGGLRCIALDYFQVFHFTRVKKKKIPVLFFLLKSPKLTCLFSTQECATFVLRFCRLLRPPIGRSKITVSLKQSYVLNWPFFFFYRFLVQFVSSPLKYKKK